jgi:hypothetical protein
LAGQERQLRLVQGGHVHDYVDSGQHLACQVCVGHRADDVRPLRRPDVEAGHVGAALAQRAHERLAQVTGAALCPLRRPTVSSNAGADRTPAWWLNLREAGARVWRAVIAMYPQAEYYTRFIERALPLIALEPEPT